MAPTIRLGTNLKAILNAQGLSLKKVSADTGIPYSTLHTWLENRQPKDICKVKVLCDYLRVDLDQLIFGDHLCRPNHNGAPHAATGANHGNPADHPNGRVRGSSIEVNLPNSENMEGIYEVIVRRRNGT
jgi:hypothetical protein